jgi:CubicO group peptidase (beta-lactamase class C family)
MLLIRFSRTAVVLSLSFLLCAGSTLLLAQSVPPLAAEASSKIDEIVRKQLASTGVPSASVAVVKDGKIIYLQAYGEARLDPKTAAVPSMRYSIGSISKQFTAAVVLMLQEQGKLSLDDKVSKWVPGLTRGDEVSIRQLLAHTSGYQDYSPQDYMVPDWKQPISAQQIMDRWAKIPLDFDPGTKWQYSNTNYVIAGVIVEKAGGKPLYELLQQRVLTPLQMTSATNTDVTKLPPSDPGGYFRYALGPLRPAPKEGPGWMYAAGELAMTAEDLAKWDISVMKQSVLKPASYREMETEVLLNNGVGTRYGLGMSVFSQNGHRWLEHGGEVSGFTAENIVLPDDGIAVVVLTNQDAVGAASQTGREIIGWLVKGQTAQDRRQDALIRKTFEDLRHGKIDRSRFTDNANTYFTDQTLADYAASIGSLGEPKRFEQTSVSLRGGMTHRGYVIGYPDKTLQINIYEMPDGKFEQFLIFAVE